MGRFLNADSLISSGHGVLGNNMFGYCLNNPANYVDSGGTDPIALQLWITGMGWLPAVDMALPIGDILYIGGILLLGTVALASDHDSVPEISYDEVDVAYGPPSPNDDDDDDDYDDYYDDDSNFGGRQKMGHNNGRAPRNNKKQNSQFDYAAKKVGLSPDKIRPFHDFITGQGGDVDELLAIAETFLSIIFVLFGL